MWFQERFTYEPWAGFLSLVCQIFGTEKFTGVMKPWVRDPKRHVSDEQLFMCGEVWLTG